MGSVQNFILLFLYLVWLQRIRRQVCPQWWRAPQTRSHSEFRQTSTTELLCENSQRTCHVDCFHKEARGRGGLQLHGIGSSRLVCKDLVQVRSNYKKSYVWWLGNLACGASAGSKWIEKDKVIYLLDLFEGRGEKEQWDLVCGASLDHWANASLCWCLIDVWWVWF